MVTDVVSAPSKSSSTPVDSMVTDVVSAPSNFSSTSVEPMVTDVVSAPSNSSSTSVVNPVANPVADVSSRQLQTSSTSVNTLATDVVSAPSNTSSTPVNPPTKVVIDLTGEGPVKSTRRRELPHEILILYTHEHSGRLANIKRAVEKHQDDRGGKRHQTSFLSDHGGPLGGTMLTAQQGPGSFGGLHGITGPVPPMPPPPPGLSPGSAPMALPPGLISRPPPGATGIAPTDTDIRGLQQRPDPQPGSTPPDQQPARDSIGKVPIEAQLGEVIHVEAQVSKEVQVEVRVKIQVEAQGKVQVKVQVGEVKPAATITGGEQ